MPERVKFDSSNLEWGEYHADRKLLRLGFKGGASYRYFEVGKWDWEDMKNAKSKGSFFQKHIRKNFRFEKEDLFPTTGGL